MGAIDGMLGLLVANGADELRLSGGSPPKMFARGVSKKLVLPPTSEELLRGFLAPLLTSEREAQIEAGARVEIGYTSEAGESFVAMLGRRTPDGGGPPVLEATFFRGRRGGAGRAGEVAAEPRGSPSTARETPPLAAREPVGGEGVDAPAPGHASSPFAPPAGAGSGPLSSTLAAANRMDTRGAIAGTARDEEFATPGPLLAALLDQARTARASDLHLLSDAPPSVRVDGRLRRLPGLGAVDVAALLEGLSPERIVQAAAGQRALDGVLEHEGMRFRMNVYRTAHGLAAAIRLLPRSVPSLAELGIPQSVGELALSPHGLVLVCGPTGSGKSATLAALAQHAVQRRAALLVGLEDPIEYLIEPGGTGGLVRQRQVGRDVPDFATGLRDALREDPDVLLVGEMRDPDTVALALTAAETGHLVLATLHSRSAPSAVERIVDACSSRRESEVRSQLAASLRAVVGQRLLPRRSRAGRVLALEVLRGTHGVASLIREGRVAQLATALQAGRKEGMMPLEASLAELVRSGEVNRADAEAAASDSAALAEYLTT